MGVEALIRWPTDDPVTPWISPAAFIPIAEENGLIIELGDWIVLRQQRQAVT
jgi:EAL domain-containing protein (putative c-di-GMP-specific phosphodiesterase class I)